MKVPKGFLFSTAQGSFKYQDRDDLALIYAPEGAVSAGVFTQNVFQAAPVLVAKKHISQCNLINAILINAGQANACTGEKGIQDCEETLRLLSKTLEISPEFILPASTGVIGEFFDLKKWEKAILELRENLGKVDVGKVARAIMTTDKYPKLVSKCLTLDNKEVHLLGLAKGAGMIAPNMATMLGFILCDAEVDRSWWQSCLVEAVETSFNRICVDGDTSTNDTVLALSSGKVKGNFCEDDLYRLKKAVKEICFELARLIVQDGEGASKIIKLTIKKAKTRQDARNIATTIATSPLVKTAFFGEDPNWGRIVAALGRSNASFDPQKIRLFFGDIEVFGCGVAKLEDIDVWLQGYMQKKELDLVIDLGAGEEEYFILFSDLTFDYVKLNGSYRS